MKILGFNIERTPAPNPRPRGRKRTQDPTREVYQLSNGLSYNTNTGVVQIEGLKKNRISRAVALQTTPVVRSITLIAGTAADLIVNTMHITDASGNRVENPTARQKAVLDRFCYHPNDYEDPHEFCTNMCVEYLITGNSLIATEMSNGKIGNIYRMISDSTHASMAPKKGMPRYEGPLYHWATRKRQTFNFDRVCHIRYPNLLGTQRYDYKAGFVVGPVDLLIDSMGIGSKIDSHINAFFESNLKNLRMMFTTDQRMEEKAQKEFQAYLDEFELSGDALGYTHNGMKVVSLNPMVIDPSMAALRKEQVMEISRIWGVPVYLLSEMKSAVNIEITARDFWDKCAKLHMNTILSAMSHRYLNNANETKGFRFAVDERELIRGNTSALVAVTNALKGDAQSPALMTSAEGREMFGLPKKMPEDPNEKMIRKWLKDRQSTATETIVTEEKDDEKADG